MASGNWTIPNIAKPKIVNGTILLASHTFKVVLVTGAPAFSATYTGSSGTAKYSDFSGSEVSGSGYTAGGVAVTVGVSGTGTVTIATTSAATWSNLSLSSGPVYAVLYDTTATNQDMLAYFPLDSGNAAQGTSYTSFSVPAETIYTYS